MKQGRWVAKALFFLLATPAFAYEAIEVKNGGTIEGMVMFSGSQPPPNIVQVGQDREVCGKTREIYEVEVKGGGVRWAVVRIADIKEGKRFDFQGVILDQKECAYVPHIMLTPPGEFTIVSSDPVPHNVHTYSVKNESVNVSMSRLKRKISISLNTPETMAVKCDLHGWMSAFIVVAEHPYYAVTGDGGRFELRDVPPGTYTLEVWHETLGKKTQEVSVKAGKTAKMEFTFRK